MKTDQPEILTSFGYWVRRQRKAVDLTQAALARHVGCARVTIKKIELDERKPSRQMAERLADCLAIPGEDRDRFVRMARGEFVLATISPSAGINTHLPKHNLPAQSTPFIGREKELADIVRRLEDPACRLLTLIGPGGTGKTRLAIESAQTVIDSQSDKNIFPHGIFFVSLAPVSSLGGLISATAETAGFIFYSDVSPRQQLLDYLREKSILLALDNLEHLLPLSSPTEKNDSSEEFIAQILATAPGVKILVTSRIALNLQEAWFHSVAGLAFPSHKNVDEQSLEKYDAVRLFMQSARRARVGFSLAAEQQNIARICWLVEGMPLAIELATAWLKMLSCDQIAHEIEHNLGFLSTRHINIPDRHRSMQAVFEQSWQLLSETERNILQRLSVFRGGFRRDAAEAVTGASLQILKNLVEKSLVQSTEAGRYQMHELLRQFAAEKLEAVPAEREETQSRHSNYYLTFLQDREQLLLGKEQQMALVEVGAEVENVRVGWNRAIEKNQVVTIDQTLSSLYNFYQIRSRYQEGQELFDYAEQHLQQPAEHTDGRKFKITQAKVMARLGTFEGLLGRTERAKRNLNAGLIVAQELENQQEIAFCLNLLGQFTGWQGDYLEARQLIQDSLKISKAINNREGMAITLHNLAEIVQFLGNNAEAKQLAQESLALSRKLERQDWIAYALDRLGFNTFILGEYVESEQYYQESLAIFEEVGDKLGQSLALGGLGWIAWAFKNVEKGKAQALGEKSLLVARDCGHQFHIATRLGMLGQILNGSGKPEQAQQAYQEGLTISDKFDAAVPMILCLSGLGDVTRQLENLSGSKGYLHKALKLGVNAGLLAHTSEALVYYASLLAGKDEHFDTDENVSQQKQAQALELAALALHHPACWHVFKVRAAQLRIRLETQLPPEIAAAACERGKSGSLVDVVNQILSQSA